MEDASTSNMSAQLTEFLPSPDEDIQVEVKAADPHSGCSPHHENGDLSEPRDSSVQETNSGEDRKENRESEAVSQEIILELNENHQNISEEPSEEGEEVTTDKNHEERQEGDKRLDSTVSRTTSEIWDELEDVICEVIEENEQGERGGVSGLGGVVEKISEVRIEVEKESRAGADEKLTEAEFVENESYSSETGEVEETKQVNLEFNDEAQHQREEVASKEPENNDEERPDEQHVTPASGVKPDRKESQEGRTCAQGDISPRGLGRKLVVSKSPKVCVVKAVPVVPPKPQHCKITALTLRQQQQQQREKQDTENTLRVLTEQDKAGERDRRRRDGDEGPARDVNRNSPLSMCFDEAVAIATMRRGKEKVCEKERQRDWGSEAQ